MREAIMHDAVDSDVERILRRVAIQTKSHPFRQYIDAFHCFGHLSFFFTSLSLHLAAFFVT